MKTIFRTKATYRSITSAIEMVELYLSNPENETMFLYNFAFKNSLIELIDRLKSKLDVIISLNQFDIFLFLSESQINFLNQLGYTFHSDIYRVRPLN